LPKYAPIFIAEIAKNPVSALKKDKISVFERLPCFKILFKVRWTPFRPFTFFTFRHVLNFAVFEQSLHLNLAPTRTKEFLCGDCRARILTSSGHNASYVLIIYHGSP
jgi:hypothetical protein